MIESLSKEGSGGYVSVGYLSNQKEIDQLILKPMIWKREENILREIIII